MERIILFDGECNLCNSSVQFILKRDKKEVFSFASLQSNFGEKFIGENENLAAINSLILIENNKYYTKSSAVLRICKRMDGFWPLLYPSIIVPHPFRNFVYDFISNNRYKWFGKQKSCMLPRPDLEKRFLK